VLAVTAAAYLVVGGLFAWRIAPGALGLRSEARFVQDATGSYDAFRWLDTQLPPAGRLLIGVRNLYWLDRPYVRATAPLFADGDPTARYLARMRDYDVRYLAFLEGQLPTPLARVRGRLERIARLSMPRVTSRTLGGSEQQWLVVYRWRG
jgi:hypothetical protein